MLKTKRYFFLIGFALLMMLCGCVRKNNEPIKEIQTLPASKGSVRQVVTFVGNVSSGQSASLTWKTTGVIDSVSVKLGDSVTEGQVLAELAVDSLSAKVINAEIPFINALEELEEVLDSETAKAQVYKELKDKEAALEKAEKYQESLKYPHATIGDIKYWSEQVDYYKKTYDDAKKSLDDAASWRNSPNESDFNLYEARRKAMLTALNNYAEAYNNYLYYSGHATENEMEQAAADIDKAQAEYDKALKNFRTYETYPREKDLAAAQLKLDNAQDTYNQRSIVSSINGVVTAINAREGDYVTQGAAAFRLDNTEHLYIPMDISEIDIGRIHDGMRAMIVLDSNPEKTYEGVVTTVSASGTSSDSRVTFETMVEILEPDEKVKIGMTGEVNLVVDEADDVLIVPANSVFKENGVSYVAVSNGTKVNDIPVTVGLISDTVAEIRGGYLREGDAVVVPSIDNSILKDMGISSSVSGQESEELLIGPLRGIN